MTGGWIPVQCELPAEDGHYEITNDPLAEDDWCKGEMTKMAYYDGYGFECFGVYRLPRFWRKFKERGPKRYGKVV